MTRFLIVGSGLTGATIARLLHDQGHPVEVIEARDHVGGNVHDHEQHGIQVHTYGPHYFRTNNERIWEFVNRFATWWNYAPCLQSEVDGQLYPWPPTEAVIEAFGGWGDLYSGPIRNFEDASLAMMPKTVYGAFVKGYTTKQWGCDPRDLAPELAGRFEVRTTDHRLKPHKHQGIPTHGYHDFMQTMLDGIQVHLNTEWDRTIPANTHLVYTGPLDAYHDYEHGHLAYRSQHREHTWHPDIDQAQPCGQVNNPGPTPHIRTLEWRHMMPKPPRHGTITTTETPIDGGYEYPIPDRHNAELATLYRGTPTPRATICGRLGEHRYMDMDTAIGRAHRITQRLTAT